MLESLQGTNTLAYHEHSKIADEKSFIALGPGACIIKLITAVICGFRNKLECLPLDTSLGWKGLPGANTVADYEHSQITDEKSFIALGPRVLLY